MGRAAKWDEQPIVLICFIQKIRGDRLLEVVKLFAFKIDVYLFALKKLNPFHSFKLCQKKEIPGFPIYCCKNLGTRLGRVH